jgi:hypothetical protein
MIPQQKALELVDKFTQTNGNAFFAKECALIAVDEILNALSYKVSSNFEEIQYYVEVKQEIEKL